MTRRVLGRYRVATANFGTAGWQRVGRLRRRRIRRMARTLATRRHDILVLTEVWLPEVRQIIANNMPRYAFTKAPGSVVVAWNTIVVRATRSWSQVAHDAVVVNGRLISDIRPIEHVLLEDLQRPGRELHVDGTHLAPIRPKLGEDAVLAGRVAQNRAFSILDAHLATGGRAKLLAGDMNNHGRFLGDTAGGRPVDYAGAVTPDRMAAVGSDDKDAELSNVWWPAFPGGDHYKGRTRLGRRRPTYLAATLTIWESAA